MCPDVRADARVVPLAHQQARVTSTTSTSAAALLNRLQLDGRQEASGESCGDTVCVSDLSVSVARGCPTVRASLGPPSLPSALQLAPVCEFARTRAPDSVHMCACVRLSSWNVRLRVTYSATIIAPGWISPASRRPLDPALPAREPLNVCIF